MTVGEVIRSNFNNDIRIFICDHKGSQVFDGIAVRMVEECGKQKFHSDLEYYFPMDVKCWRIMAETNSYCLEVWCENI